MNGRLRDAWPFAWPEIWLPLEESEIWGQLVENSDYTTDQLYVDVYVELAKALKKAPQPTQYDAVSNNPLLARLALSTTPATALRGETARARFFENAFEAIGGAGSPDLEDEFRTLVDRFLKSRNLRYQLIEPFELRSHLPGIFEAIVADLLEAANRHPQLSDAFSDFMHAFHALQRSHAEPDMKTCIHKAGMLAEALASARPEARGNNFGALCNSIHCWPNPLVREAIKKLYEIFIRRSRRPTQHCQARQLPTSAGNARFNDSTFAIADSHRLFCSKRGSARHIEKSFDGTGSATS
jgi:hypothetical protein